MQDVQLGETERLRVEELRTLFEASLSKIAFDNEPQSLYEPTAYVLDGRGKRFRPVLFLLTSQAFDVTPTIAMPGALAFEVFHNFTLVHDDIMDHADLRRGRATVHKKWDEPTAILCGDFLMALSYRLITRLPFERMDAIVDCYHTMVRKLCEGQALDKEFEMRDHVSIEEYIYMIDRKTGALLEAVFEIGGLVGGANSSQLEQLRSLGTHLGRAFQIQDDLLDLTAETKQWGKKVGGDLIEGKKAYLLLKAMDILEPGEEYAFFESIIKRNGLEEQKIPEARRILEESGVLLHARDEVIKYSDIAMKCTDALPQLEARNTVQWLIKKMQHRVH